MRILIIKLGYSETLDPEIGKVPSLGDVLRTTPILWALREKYPNSHVSWLVSPHAELLLRGNPLIDRLLVWDEFVPFQLMREKVDVLINLEKIPGIAALADMTDAWVKYGFRFDGVSGDYHTYERGLDFLKYISNKATSHITGDYWQKILIEMLGVEWKGQEYIIGYRPKTTKEFDIGLNYQVGSKFPQKAMPYSYWEQLANLFQSAGYNVCWQQGLDNLYDYIDWINACEVLISQDSLGLHIALALKKKVVGLFGPTDPQEVYPYENSKIIHSDQQCPLMPCYSVTKCLNGLECMTKIDLNKVFNAVNALLTH